MPVPTFDGLNLLVTLPTTVNGVLSMDVSRDLYSEWKEWFLLADNAKFPLLFRESVGGDTLQGTLTAGAYFFFQNTNGWRLKPFEGNGEYTFVGNLIAEDETAPMLVKTTGAFTVLVNGLQPITQNISAQDVEHSSFDGGVTIDPVKGVDGTTGTIGNSRTPVKTFADALIIATNRGLNTFFIKGSITFQSTDVLDGFHVKGISTIATNIFTFTAGCSTKDTTFEGAHLTGTVLGNMNIKGCVFLTLGGVGYDSIIMDSIFEGTVSYSGLGTLNVLRCSSGLPAGHSEMDWTGVPIANANISEWSGGLGIAGLSVGTVAINMVSGSLHIHSDVSGGKIEITPDNINVLNDSINVNLVGGALTSTVLSDAGNTALSFKTGFVFSQTNAPKDSLIKFLSGVLKGEVKKVLSYDAITKIFVFTSAFSTIPVTGDLMKLINE